MFLTAEELAELTEHPRPSAQVRWLEDRGWPYELSGKKRPKVLRAVAFARMGGTVPGQSNEGPNWEALNGTA